MEGAERFLGTTLFSSGPSIYFQAGINMAAMLLILEVARKFSLVHHISSDTCTTSSTAVQTLSCPQAQTH